MNPKEVRGRRAGDGQTGWRRCAMGKDIQDGRGPIFTRFFLLMCLFEAFSSISMQMVSATIAGYALWLGGLSSVAGVLSGIYFVFSIAARPVSGYLGNRWQKKRLLLIATVVLCLSSIGMTVSRTLPGIMFFRAVQGIGYSFQTAVNFAIVSERAPAGRSGEALGYYGLAGVIAQMTAPSFALLLVRQIGYRPMLWVSTAMRVAAVLCIAAAGAADPEQETEAKPPARAFSWADVIARESLLPAVMGMLFALLNSVVTGFMALYAESYAIPGAEYFFALCAAATFAGRLLTSKKSDQMTLAFTGVRSGCMLVAAMMLLGVGRSTVTMLLAAVIFGGGYGSLLPVTQSRAIKYAPDGRKSSGSNTYFLGIDSGFALGNVFGGFFAGRFGYGMMYLAYGIPAILSMVIAVRYGKGR